MKRDGALAWPALAGALIATGLATYFILLPQGHAAGWAAAFACVCLTAASVVSHADVTRFVGAVLYRGFDGLVLSAIAWQTRSVEPQMAVAALLSLAGGFLAAYFSARGRSLGYGIDSSTVNRFLRTGLVAVALLSVHPAPWMWSLAVLSLLTAVVRASQAFKEEMA